MAYFESEINNDILLETKDAMKTLENLKGPEIQLTMVHGDADSCQSNPDLSRLVNSFEAIRNRFSKNAFREMMNDINIISFVFSHDGRNGKNLKIIKQPEFFMLTGNRIYSIKEESDFDKLLINKLMLKIQVHYKDELDEARPFDFQHFIPSLKKGAWSHVSIIPMKSGKAQGCDDYFLCITTDIFKLKDTEETIVSLKHKIMGYAEKNQKLLEYNDSVDLYIHALINLLDEYEARIRAILNEIKKSVDNNLNELVSMNY